MSDDWYNNLGFIMRPTTKQFVLSISRLASISIICIMVLGFTPTQHQEITVHRPDVDVTPVTLPVHKDVANITAHRLTVDKEELRCLALNIYFEARSEPLMGQLAVAGVTLNRVADRRYPGTICDVVKQGEHRRHACQFSWMCDGKLDDPTEKDAWVNARHVALLFMAGVYEDPTQNALWYHADYVNPFWAAKKDPVIKIGRHIFYVEKRTQTASLY